MTEKEVRAKRGIQSSINGFAYEYIAIGILMKKYQNVSKVDLPHSPYDLIIVRKNDQGQEDTIRVSVRTASNIIKFTAGGRGGVERREISKEKHYVYNTKVSDIVLGIYPISEQAFDLYMIPTILIETLQTKSISTKKASPLKNNYELLERCRDAETVIRKANEYGILPK